MVTSIVFSVDEILHFTLISCAMLAAKRLAGVTPEVNFRSCVACTPLPSMSKAACSGFETQKRCHQKSKRGISVVP